MSVTVHQILNDAKRLVNRLREHDSAADNIIQQSQTLYRNVEAMKEYNEEVSELNAANEIRSRSSFIFSAQQENKHILELQQENRALVDLVEEHQSAMELIMSKYRQNMTQLVCDRSKTDSKPTENHTKELQKMADSICEIADVMKQSVKIDDESYTNDRERLTELVTENKGLRELLEISRIFGSLHVPLNSPETADKEIQTDTNS